MTCCNCHSKDVDFCEKGLWRCQICDALTITDEYEEEVFPSRELTPEQLAAIDSIPF